MIILHHLKMYVSHESGLQAAVSLCTVDLLYALFFHFSRTFGNCGDLNQFWTLVSLNSKVCLVSLES